MFLTKGNMRAIYRQFQMYLDNELRNHATYKELSRVREIATSCHKANIIIQDKLDILEKEILELKIKIADREDLIKIIKGE